MVKQRERAQQIALFRYQLICPALEPGLSTKQRGRIVLAQNRPDLPAEKLARTRKLMCDAIPDVLVEGYEPLEPAFDLPDPDDRHVLAAAVKAGAQVIVTENLRDFPDYGLSPWGVEAKAPDDFLVDQYHLNRVALRNIVDDIVATRARGDSFDDVLAELRSNGLAQTASLLGYGV